MNLLNQVGEGSVVPAVRVKRDWELIMFFCMISWVFHLGEALKTELFPTEPGYVDLQTPVFHSLLVELLQLLPLVILQMGPDVTQVLQGNLEDRDVFAMILTQPERRLLLLAFPRLWVLLPAEQLHQRWPCWSLVLCKECHQGWVTAHAVVVLGGWCMCAFKRRILRSIPTLASTLAGNCSGRQDVLLAGQRLDELQLCLGYFRKIQ